MSDNHRLSQSSTLRMASSSPSTSTLGEVNHLNQLSQHLSALYLSDEFSDVTLLIDSHRLPAHRVVLAARSDYFRAMLYNGMKETTMNEIEMKVNSLPAFKYLLKYIYTGHIQLASFNDEMVLEIFVLSHQFGLTNLDEAIVKYLQATLNLNNVCMIYDTSILFSIKSLSEESCSFLDRHAHDVLHHESFFSLSSSTLKEILTRDSFCAQEIDIFKAVREWTKRNPSEDVADIMSVIRLPLISNQDLLSVVRQSGLISSDAILDAITVKGDLKDTELKYRGVLIVEDNVASKKHNAQVIINGERDVLSTSGDGHYDMEKGFGRHHIDENNGQGIVLKLGMQCIVNHIRMLLFDKDARSYSYYIEVSIDGKDWLLVVDHKHYLCRSWQCLYFPARVVRYVRIVGTHNTVNRIFHIVALECMYTHKKFVNDSQTGLLIPDYNVATVMNCAWVIEGVSRSRNTLINGDCEHYDWDSGYTCHQLGSGSIVVQLAQPFMIDSMRLLLWDTDSRSYSYYIEVSVDQQHWHLVADKRDKLCQAWQVIHFPLRPVVFIKIVGTYNTSNEVFHVVHFECPAQIEDKKVGEEEPSEEALVNKMKEKEKIMIEELTEEEDKDDDEYTLSPMNLNLDLAETESASDGQ